MKPSVEGPRNDAAFSPRKKAERLVDTLHVPSVIVVQSDRSRLMVRNVQTKASSEFERSNTLSLLV